MREEWEGHGEQRRGYCGKRTSHVATRKKRSNIRRKGEKIGHKIKGGRRSEETNGWK